MKKTVSKCCVCLEEKELVEHSCECGSIIPECEDCVEMRKEITKINCLVCRKNIVEIRVSVPVIQQEVILETPETCREISCEIFRTIIALCCFLSICIVFGYIITWIFYPNHNFDLIDLPQLIIVGFIAFLYYCYIISSL